MEAEGSDRELLPVCSQPQQLESWSITTISMLLLAGTAIVIFVLGCKMGIWLKTPQHIKVKNKSTQSQHIDVKNKSTQSQCTYTRHTSNPRFKVLAEVCAGAASED